MLPKWPPRSRPIPFCCKVWWMAGTAWFRPPISRTNWLQFMPPTGAQALEPSRFTKEKTHRGSPTGSSLTYQKPRTRGTGSEAHTNRFKTGMTKSEGAKEPIAFSCLAGAQDTAIGHGPISVVSHVRIDNRRDPLTRPAPAGDNAGCAPPSPQRGEGNKIHPPLGRRGDRGARG